jgi:hypothetical protein
VTIPAAGLAGVAGLYSMYSGVNNHTPQEKKYNVIQSEIKKLTIEKNNLEESIEYLQHSHGSPAEIKKDQLRHKQVTEQLNKLDQDKQRLEPIVDGQIRDSHSTPYTRGRFGIEPVTEPTNNVDIAANFKPQNLAVAPTLEHTGTSINHHEAPVNIPTVITNNYYGGNNSSEQTTTYRTPADIKMNGY